MCSRRSKMNIGFSKPNFLGFSGFMAKSKGIFLKQGKPSNMWWCWLKFRRTRFFLPTPESTGTARHDAMSRERLQRYFQAFGEIILYPNFHYQPCKIGVPQRSILSVTLFSIKINSLDEGLRDSIQDSLYVDDLDIRYKSKNMNSVERQLLLCFYKIQNWD